MGQDFEAKFAAAYYYFQNIEGKLSDPFTPLNASDQGDTDDTRPAFAQTGNTYMALRDIVPSALNDFGTINQFQYFGLATPFRDLALDGRLDYNHFAPVQVSLIGEFIDNVAFNRGEINAKAVNNLGPGGTGDYAGGNIAWIATLRVGDAVLAKRWDWNVSLGYRYVESDSVVDGFNDADFGGTRLGTNLKGYTIGGNLALSPARLARPALDERRQHRRPHLQERSLPIRPQRKILNMNPPFPLLALAALPARPATAACAPPTPRRRPTPACGTRCATPRWNCTKPRPKPTAATLQATQAEGDREDQGAHRRGRCPEQAGVADRAAADKTIAGLKAQTRQSRRPRSRG